MIELCKINRLKVIRDTPQGLYLADKPFQKTDDETQDEKDICESKQKCLTNSEGKNTKDNSTLKASAARFTGKSEDVLLPRPEVPRSVNVGDELDVFIYLDSQDRYTATLRTPHICLGRMSVLKVVQVTDIGVFLDWGLEKNLLLPFKEVVTPLYFDPLSKATRRGNNKALTINSGRAEADRTANYIGKDKSSEQNEGSVETGRAVRHTGKNEGPVTNARMSAFKRNGDVTSAGLSPADMEWLGQDRELPVVLYIDKSGRPAATMRVYDRLTAGEKYSTDSAVEATVIQINPSLGVFVAVDDRYFGMININEITDIVNVGDRIFGRISGARDDGKYMVSLMQKAHLQMDNDAQVVLRRLRDSGGRLPLGDKSDAQDIMRELGMSKKAFKRAVGQLYKEGRVVPGAYEIVCR